MQFNNNIAAEAAIVQTIATKPVVMHHQPIAILQHLGCLALGDVVTISVAAIIDGTQTFQEHQAMFIPKAVAVPSSANVMQYINQVPGLRCLAREDCPF
eukprot:10785913-Lingulodinium_polyedra.AAC.1